MELTGFKTEDYQSENNFTVIPPGEYNAVITSSEHKQTKAGNGSGILFTFEIIEGESKGRKLFKWINWENQSEIAQRIGREELARLCQATNSPDVERTEELHDKPLLIKVKTGKDRDGEDRAVVHSFFAHKVNSILAEDKVEEDVAY